MWRSGVVVLIRLYSYFLAIFLLWIACVTLPVQLLPLLISGSIPESTSARSSTRASSAVARASVSVIAAIASSIPTLSVGAISVVLAIVITIVFAVIKLLPRVVIKVELLYLMRANSGVNYKS